MQALRDYISMRDKIRPDYDRLVKEAPAELKVLEDELAVREKALDAVWAQAVPEMNPLERKRYAAMIGHDPAGAPLPPAQALPAGPVTEYPQSVVDALDRVKRFFPDAKIVAFAKPGEKLVIPESKFAVPRVSRPEVRNAPVVGIKRDEPAPAAEPAKPAEPEQPRLL